MSLLTLIQGAASLCKVTVPTVVTTSTDKNVILLLALANEAGPQLMKRYEWQELTNFSGTIATGGTLAVGTVAARPHRPRESPPPPRRTPARSGSPRPDARRQAPRDPPR